MPDRQISPRVSVVEPELDTELRIRVHGNPQGATLIYLPGVHGDWTLIGGFRRALGGQLRFVEITYPRTRSGSLADYAAGLERVLAETGIHHGWLLGESFGSQIVWEVLRGGHFNAHGVVLAGGLGGTRHRGWREQQPSWPAGNPKPYSAPVCWRTRKPLESGSDVLLIHWPESTSLSLGEPLWISRPCGTASTWWPKTIRVT